MFPKLWHQYKERQKKYDVVFLSMECVIFVWFYLVAIILLPAFENTLFCFATHHLDGILSLFLFYLDCACARYRHRSRDISWEIFHKNDECKKTTTKENIGNSCLESKLSLPSPMKAAVKMAVVLSKRPRKCFLFGAP